MFDIVGKRNWFFLFSGLILVPGLICILLTPLSGGKYGLQFSTDYTNGTTWQIQFADKNVTADDVQSVLKANGLTDANVSLDSQNYFTIKTKRTDLLPEETLAPPTPTPNGSASATASPTAAPTASPTAAPTATSAASGSGAASGSPAATATPVPTASPSASPTATPTASPTPAPSPTQQFNSIDQNGKPCNLIAPPPGSLIDTLTTAFARDGNTGPIACVAEESTIGPSVSAELVAQTVLLIIIGSFCILTWITIRFWSAGGLKFGITALVALVHDVVVVVGIFAVLGTLFGLQIDSLFVTAVLTVIGFSVHDTIVVFDRIRENRARHAGEPFDQIVNHSILQTFGRSINTSFTVVLTLTALLLFAGASIKFFVLALLIGIISGTYSSIFNASMLLVVWQLWADRRKEARMATMRPVRRART